MVDMHTYIHACTYTRTRTHTIQQNHLICFHNLSSLYKYVCCIAVENCFNEGSFTIYLIYVTFFSLGHFVLCVRRMCILYTLYRLIFVYSHMYYVHSMYSLSHAHLPTHLPRFMFIQTFHKLSSCRFSVIRVVAILSRHHSCMCVHSWLNTILYVCNAVLLCVPIRRTV